MLFHLEFVLPLLVRGIHISSGDSNAEQTILALNFQTCNAVDLNSNHLICEIHSKDDVFVRSSGCEMPEPLCPDGSINKTCFPMRDDKILSYQCMCHSRRRADFIVPVTAWTTWAASTNPYQPFAGERSLILPLVNQAVAQEFRRMDVFIISYYNLPSSVFSASSTSAGHEAFRAHLNFGGVGPCAWLGTGSTPWLQITLLTQYVIVGAVIKQRCDSPHTNQYATRVKITTSVNGVSWETIIESEDVIYDVYDGQGKYSMWFPREYTNRYWRIQIIAYNEFPALKVDLVGCK